MQVLSSWSGGKDSCFALMHSKNEGNHISGLLNMMNEDGEFSRAHGIPLHLLEQQAKAIGVPIHAQAASWGDYEYQYSKCLDKLKIELGIQGVVFGDIDLEAHREWEEKICQKSGLTPLLPLWQQNRKQLVFDMIDSGIETIIVSCNLAMGEKFLGKKITKEIVEELEVLGIDACGENGEYHTLVVDCPLFKDKIKLASYSTIKKEDYCFMQWN